MYSFERLAREMNEPTYYRRSSGMDCASASQATPALTLLISTFQTSRVVADGGFLGRAE